jgi:zinc protease
MYVFSMESAAGQANLLAAYEALGDYRLAEEHLKKLNAVTGADVHRVANGYLTLTNCSLLEYVPKEAKLDPVTAEALARTFAIHFVSVKPEDKLEQPGFAERIVSYLPRNVRDKEITKHELSNGMALLIKESHQIPLATIGIFARGGRGNEIIAEAGLTGLMLRTSLKGTQNRSAAQIASEIENLGTAIHFTNAADYLYYSLSILSKNFAAGFDILADVITESIFPEVEVAKEKENILAQILREKDDMSQHPINLLYSLLFKGHPYGVSQFGEPEAVQSIQREQLLVWHHRHIHPGNLLAVVVGDVDTNKVIELLERQFGPRPIEMNWTKNNSKISEPTKIEELIETREREQTALVLGFPGPRYNDDDYYALLVLQNAIAGLGGRFFEELRSRQSLAYAVSVSAVSRLHAGAFVSYIATSPEKEAAAKSGLLAEFEKLTKEPLTDEELRRSIQFTVGTHQIGLETYRAQMLEYAHNELLGKGVEELHLFPQKIERVTAEDILRAAQRYFDLNRYVLAMVRGINHKN